MDHPCYKCGQAVEDGTAFCSRCGAPQIRVVTPDAGSTLAADGSTILAQEVGVESPTNSPQVQPFAVQWNNALPACGIAAFTAALLICLGLMVPILAMLGSGFLAVALYRRRSMTAVLQPWSGAQIGALSGLFSFGMSAIFEAIGVALFHSGTQIRDKLLQAIQQAASRTSDPQAQQIFEYFKSPPGMALVMIFFLFFGLIFFVLLGGTGGALAGVFFRRHNRSH